MKIFIKLILIFASINSFGQVPGKTQVTKITNIPKYDAISGDRLSEKQFLQMVKEHPGMVPKKETDKYGNITKLIFDPTRTGQVNDRNPEMRVKPGEDFLPFVMKTIDGTKLDSEKLRGKKILIHCELSLEEPMFSEKAFEEAKNLVFNPSKSQDMVFILLTEDSVDEMRESFLTNNLNLNIVADASTFFQRFIVTSFPCNVLIDEDGKLVSYYTNIEFEQLEKILK